MIICGSIENDSIINFCFVFCAGIYFDVPEITPLAVGVHRFNEKNLDVCFTFSLNVNRSSIRFRRSVSNSNVTLSNFSVR